MLDRMEPVSKFIKDVGFPVFVAVYLLMQVVALGPKVEAIAKSLEQIANVETRILYLLERGGGTR